MKKITSIDELQQFIENRTNIHTVKRGKCLCYRVIGRNPFTMRKTDVEYTLVEKNSHETMNVRQLTLDGTDFYVGEYDAKFIGEIIIAYYQWEIDTVRNIYINNQK
jgi:hypothetical protein